MSFNVTSGFPKEGIKIIDDIVKHWTCKYSHLTTFCEKNDKTYKQHIFLKIIILNFPFLDFYANSVYQPQTNLYQQQQSKSFLY